MRNIGFRDRPLNTWERSHYYCKRCGASLHPDTMHRHKCKPK